LGIDPLLTPIRLYVDRVEHDPYRAESSQIPAPRRRAARTRGTAAWLALVALVAACGGSYTKQDFVARANAICADALRQTRAIPPPTGAQNNRSLAAYLAQVLPIAQSEASQLRALRSPPGTAREKALLARYFSASTQQVAAIRQLKAAAARGDAQGVAEAEALLRASPVTALATRYGLRSCGTPGSTAV
jgi:hypothetical protein